MKLSSIMCASAVTLAAVAFTAGGAVAKDISDGAAKGQATERTAPLATTCQTGQSWNAATKKCVAATPLNNRQNVSGTATQSTTTTTPPPK